MIVLSGASSVGKTTLADDWCQKHVEYHHIKEIAREIMRKNSISRADLKSFIEKNKKKFFDFQHLIMEEQNIIETTLMERNQCFIVDRGPDPLVFMHQYISHESALKLAETDAAKSCLQRYRSKDCIVVVVCPLDTIEDDNVRMVPTHQEQIDYTECLTHILNDMNIPYCYCNETDRHERLKWLEQLIICQL